MKAFLLNLFVSFIALAVFIGGTSNGFQLGEDFWLVLAVTSCAAPALLLVGIVLAIMGICRRQELAANVAALLLPLALLALCLLA